MPILANQSWFPEFVLFYYPHDCIYERWVMSESNDDTTGDDQVEDKGLSKVTSFGEPLWLDALKSIVQGLVMLVFVLVLGGALAIDIIAPWGRASHDCSVYCVLERQFKKYWSD